ncbi:lipoyl(octanoyl) transferase LipB [Mycetocola reblochoni]|uniref:Octanoyltransferase n=2 Tax=Mycetocola reblochoni TaxID=331618 RepID=A0A1R4JCI1_9MICO|nr:lipoyl(octanoyl) transferase LipB [Mycetocola reblochoni]RLP69998.1 lipoyl(octanoyl) transferase LipB [Mycetocola reblochoni]SJN29423.1 Octanoate-[acyl-carrier-protein]-protein-N-octan oyltransferase [Mycetocola reblochoni REB411]
MIDVIPLGLAPSYVPFRTALAEQRRLHAERVADRAGDTMLLLEHTAVYTAGAQTRRSELPEPPAVVERVDRGGRITWHGPGQLIGYPIVRLPQPLDVVAHVRRLEQGLIAALRTASITGYTVAGRSGVWVRDPGGSESKIAAIGVRVERNVTRHGFALNCSNELSPFDRIVPCGITDRGVTSISTVLGRTVTPAQLLDVIATTVSEALLTAGAGTGHDSTPPPRSGSLAGGAR